MRRRSFIVGLGVASLAAGQPRAQRRLPRLALLLTEGGSTPANSAWTMTLRAALGEYGWIEGRTIEIITRYADGDFDRLPVGARRYLERLSEVCGVPIDMISTGPDRDETIVRRHPFL